jgi:hypothetical protein
MSKTVKIAEILQTVNTRNELSTCSREMRQGWNSLVESILMAANVYIGFGYLTSIEIPQGKLPGISYVDPDGEPITPEEFSDEMSLANQEGRKPACGKTFPDDSRRTYFVHHDLQKDYQAADTAASRPGEIEREPTDIVEASKDFL